MTDKNTNKGKLSEGMGAYVDQNTCIGCMLCTQIAPNVFQIGDTGKSHAINPTGDSEDTINEAIHQCPVEAISWKKQ